GTFAAEILLKPGDNPIQVRAIDINGNAQEETLTIYRSESAKLAEGPKPPDPLTPPTIVILAPEGGRVGPRETRTTLRGRVTIPVRDVTVNGKAATLKNDGTFSAPVTLETGENAIIVAAMDTQRHVTEQTFTIYRPTGAGPRKMALLIGNAEYKLSPLRTAVNDA